MSRKRRLTLVLSLTERQAETFRNMAISVRANHAAGCEAYTRSDLALTNKMLAALRAHPATATPAATGAERAECIDPECSLYADHAGECDSAEKEQGT